MTLALAAACAGGFVIGIAVGVWRAPAWLRYSVLAIASLAWAWLCVPR